MLLESEEPLPAFIEAFRRMYPPLGEPVQVARRRMRESRTPSAPQDTLSRARRTRYNVLHCVATRLSPWRPYTLQHTYTYIDRNAGVRRVGVEAVCARRADNASRRRRKAIGCGHR